MSTENPIRAARTSLGLTRTELAAILGRTYSSVSTIEAGGFSALDESLREGFESLGIDFDALAAAYAAWRFEIRRRLVEGAANA